MPRARLLRSYRTRYRDPVAFAAGDAVEVGARDTEWPEYLWATDPRGRRGWVHQRYVDRELGTARATSDYSAQELDADAGDAVRLIEEAGGWWWCENEHGAHGWLPARDLQIESE